MGRIDQPKKFPMFLQKDLFNGYTQKKENDVTRADADIFFLTGIIFMPCM